MQACRSPRPDWSRIATSASGAAGSAAGSTRPASAARSARTAGAGPPERPGSGPLRVGNDRVGVAEVDLGKLPPAGMTTLSSSNSGTIVDPFHRMPAWMLSIEKPPARRNQHALARRR